MYNNTVEYGRLVQGDKFIPSSFKNNTRFSFEKVSETIGLCTKKDKFLFLTFRPEELVKVDGKTYSRIFNSGGK